MAKQRSITKITETIRDDIADLVTRRALPTHEVDQVDPFLFLNHHGPQTYPRNNQGLPFGPHPHRGFETVTFIITGDLTHRDSAGHESVITAGGVQWMTAGSGLVHSETSSEEFKKSGGDLEILQLWLNLPAKLKMSKPAYRGLQATEIPAIEKNGVRINLSSGKFENSTGAFGPLTDVSLMTVEMKADAEIELPAPEKTNVFFYVVRGEVNVDAKPISKFHLAQFANDGDVISVRASKDAVILYGFATPYNEPVFSHGPFVMNTREEIIQAIEDYQAGKFE